MVYECLYLYIFAVARNSQLGSSGYNWEFDVTKPHKKIKKKTVSFFNTAKNIFSLLRKLFKIVCKEIRFGAKIFFCFRFSLYIKCTFY